MSTVYILIVAVYAALPTLNAGPHEFARFASREACEAARAAVESKTERGRQYIGYCASSIDLLRPK